MSSPTLHPSIPFGRIGFERSHPACIQPDPISARKHSPPHAWCAGELGYSACVKFGIALGALNPSLFDQAVLEAERLGFESCWLPEHLVLTEDMSGSPHPGEDLPPVPPTTPVFDAFAMLSYLAGITERIRLGTNVYLLGLRHPFVAARAVQTLDLISKGRAEIGIGAGWLRQEWHAAGLDPATRGRRLDEALVICKRLWSEESIAHQGEFFRFEPVRFDPKPIQKPYPRIHVGGESEAALERAARVGDGWLGLHHTLESVRPQIHRINELRNTFERADHPFEVTVGGSPDSLDQIQSLEEAGVTRLIVRPWRRTSEAMDGIGSFAERFIPNP